MPNYHSPLQQQSPEAVLKLNSVKQKLLKYSYNKTNAMDTSAAPAMASAVDATAADTSTSNAAAVTPKPSSKRVRVSESPEILGAAASSVSSQAQAPTAILHDVDISDIPDLTQEQMMREVTRNLRYLLADNKSIHSDLHDLKNAVNFQDGEIENLKKQNAELTEQNLQLEIRLTAAEIAIKKNAERITNAETAADDLEAHGRKINLEISGFPKKRGEPIDIPRKIAVAVFEKIGFNDADSKIDVAHRIVGDRIIVRFTGRRERDQVYKLRKELKNLNTSNIDTAAFAEHLDLPTPGNSIFINESLSFKRRKLMGEINQKMKIRNHGRSKETRFHTFSAGGKIFVMDENRVPKPVSKISDLYAIQPFTVGY